MRTSGVICFVLFIFAIDTGSSYSEIFQCDEQVSHNHYYETNATFSDVFIHGSIGYTFNCEYAHYKLAIFFINSSLDDVPKKLFDTFVNLRNVTLSNCNITNINRYSLERASQLQLLDVSKNALEEVKGYAFDGAHKLMILNLALNRISTIEPTAFQSLPVLHTLYLQGNMLRTLSAELFSGLVGLRHIFLHNNELELIEAGLFEANVKLQNVLLDDNRISVFDESALGSNRLTLLSLRNNRLTKLNLRNARVQKVLLANNLLEELFLSPWIQIVYAQHNNISQIVTNRTQALSITTLSLENNSISSLDMINWMQTLEVLDLTNNKLGQLPIDSFAKLTNLQQLRLERTGISNLQHGTFAQLEQLLWLDLSYNDLDKVDLDILTSSSLLQTLYLDGNRLKAIEYGNMKKMFPQLVELGLADNRWNCSFLSHIVRYCNENNIRLVKDAPSEDVLRQTNVKGIYCYDEKNPIRHWNATVEHLLGANVSEAGALQAMLRSVLDDVQRFGERHGEAANRTDKLEGTLSDLTRRQISLDGALVDLRRALLDLRLSLMSNLTNVSAVGSGELRRMIDSVNNLTLEKQQLAEERLALKINAQSFRVDQALETARANGDKLTVLGKRVEDWLGSMLSPGGAAGHFDKLHQQQQQQTQVQATAAGSGGHESTGLLVAVLVMVCLLTGVLVFALLRGSRRSYGTERRRYTNRDSSLTTIVDNDI